MNKYIDSNKLIAEIERMREINRKAFEAEHIESGVFHGRTQAINHLLDTIIALQQEQTEIEKEAEISPSMVSNFGPCAFNLSVTFTQDEMNKMNIAPFFTKKANVIIKDSE